MGAADVQVLLASESQQPALVIRGAGLLLQRAQRIQALGGAVTVRAEPSGVRLTTPAGTTLLAQTLMLRTAGGALYVRRPDAKTEKLVEGSLSIGCDKGRLVPVALIPEARYVAGVLGGETAPETPWQARLAQTILARTYWRQERRHPSVDADACDQSHCQYYRAPAREKDLEAERATQGQVLTNASGTPLPVYYHANCGGYTAPVHIVFGGRPWPHLKGVADPGCEPRAPWQAQLPSEDCRQALQASRLWDHQPLHAMAVDDKLASGWPVTVRLSGQRTKNVPAYYWWLAMGQRFGWGMVPSGFFTLKQDGDRVFVTGRGIGHGVGLCQVGANRWARSGRTADWIIDHYFPGAKVSRR